MVGIKADNYSTYFGGGPNSVNASTAAIRFRNLSGATVNVTSFDNSNTPQGLVGPSQLYYSAGTVYHIADWENFGTVTGIQDFWTDAKWVNQATVQFLSGKVVFGEGLNNASTGVVQGANVQLGSLRSYSSGYPTPTGLSSNAGIILAKNASNVRGDLTIHQQNEASSGQAASTFTNAATGQLQAASLTVGYAYFYYYYGVNTTLANQGTVDILYGDINGSLVNQTGATVTTGGLRIGDAFPYYQGYYFAGSLVNSGSINLSLSSTPPSGWTATDINTITVAGDFTNRGTLTLPVAGAPATAQWGRVKLLRGSADLDGGLILTPSGSPTINYGDAYTIVTLDLNTSYILGGFDGLPEGGAVPLLGNVFHVSYHSGTDSNDMVIINNGPYVKISDPFVTEGDAPVGQALYSDLNFIISLDTPSIAPITIPYNTIDLEATAGSDYEAKTGTVTIPIGGTSATVTVRVLKDTISELTANKDRNERLTLRLGQPTTNNAILQKSGGMGTILGDDGPVDASDSRGRDFWLAYTNTLDTSMSGGSGTSSNDYMVYVAGIPGTAVTITAYRQNGDTTNQVINAVIPANGLLEQDLADRVLLPNATGIINSTNTTGGGQFPTTFQSSTVNITANQEVSVYSLMFFDCGTSSSALAFPTDVLGGEYRVLAPRNTSSTSGVSGYPSGTSQIAGGLFAAIATVDDTKLTITPTVDAGGNAAGIPFTVTLQRGQVYQYIAKDRPQADLSGTLVTSDKPIAVISGHQFAEVPLDQSHKDSVMESVPPINTWGKEFIIVDTKRDPIASQPAIKDNYRVVATENDTVVRLNNSVVAILDAGQVHEFQLDGQGVIKANKPIMVAQMTDGSPNASASSNPNHTGTVGWSMPAEILIPPYEQFLADYTLAVPSYFPDGYVNLVTPTIGIPGLRHDSQELNATELATFQPVANTEYSVARIKVTPGQSHRFSGTLPFGVSVYGFEFHNTHGYLGGLSLAPISTASGIALTPPVATRQVTTSHSVTAKVTNNDGTGVPGLRVDFRAAGSNQSIGFAVTDIRGEATFEYVGMNLGHDNLTASVGQLLAQAEVDWQVAPPTIRVTSPGDGSSFQAGESLLISGQARAGQSGVRVTRVTMDDVPVEAVDELGNFFNHIVLPSGKTTVKFTAYDSYGQSTSVNYTLNGTVAPQRGIDTRSLIEAAGVVPQYLRTSFFDDRKLLFTEVRFTNNGGYDLEKPLYIGVRNLSDPSIVVNDFDGMTPDGTYYWNFASQVPSTQLAIGQTTASRNVSFRNPNRLPFTFSWVVLAEVNDPPKFYFGPSDVGACWPELFLQTNGR